MKPTLIALVALVGCGESKEEKAAKAQAAAEEAKTAAEDKAAAEAKAVADWKVIEKAIRKELKKPTGELTEADLEKVTSLNLAGNQLTEIPKGLEKLTQLRKLFLFPNPGLTEAQIEELHKALPRCVITW